MKRLLLTAVCLLALAACKTDEQRAHELRIHQLELQAQAEARQLQIEADERVRARQVEASAETKRRIVGTFKALGVLAVIGAVLAAAFHYISQVLEARLQMIRDVRLKEEEARTDRYKFFVEYVGDSENGMSEADRRKALALAAQAIGGHLTYDPGAG